MYTTILDHLDTIPVGDVRLGRLVLNPLEPHQDFCDPSGSLDASITCQAKSFENVRNSIRSTSLQSRFTKFLSGAFSDKNDYVKDVSAGEVEIYKLNNSGKWFRESCKDAKVREWLEDALDQDAKIYLIVGYCVLTNTHSTQEGTRSAAVSASARVPISVADAGTILSVSVSGAHDRTVRERSVAHFPGQTVCAVQCRKLKFKWLCSQELDNGFLEQGNRWKLKGTFRGEDEYEEEDVTAGRESHF